MAGEANLPAPITAITGYFVTMVLGHGRIAAKDLVIEPIGIAASAFHEAQEEQRQAQQGQETQGRHRQLDERQQGAAAHARVLVAAHPGLSKIRRRFI